MPLSDLWALANSVYGGRLGNKVGTNDGWLYRGGAIAGPGTSLYETRGIVAVGESAFGAMVQSPLKGEPWKIARLFGGDGRTPAQVTAAQALDMLT